MKFVLAAYGSRGDVEPCIAVGRELLRRDHEVRVAVPPNMLPLADSAGLAAVAYGPDSQRQVNIATDFVRRIQHPIAHVKVVAAVNHAAVFPACRAVVHHGGAGTTAAGMRAGIPALVLWLWLDQPIWAAAVERLGVGAARRFSDITQDSLVADLRSILTARCANRAREIAGAMTKPAESVGSVADLLEDAARQARITD